MSTDTQTQWERSALLLIDAPDEVCGMVSAAGSSAVGSAVTGAMSSLAQAFRQAGLPIIHVVGLHHGEMVGAQNPANLENDHVLAGGLHKVAAAEFIMYRPHWSAFDRTALRQYLQEAGVTTLVIAGSNFPTSPRATIYDASAWGFQVVLAADALSHTSPERLADVAEIDAVVSSVEDISAAVVNTTASGDVMEACGDPDDAASTGESERNTAEKPSNRDLMLAGKPYQAQDPVNEQLARRAVLLMEKFARLYPHDEAAAREVLCELVGRLGAGAHIKPPLWVDYGGSLEVGERTFINYGLTALDVAAIKIGADCQLGPHVQLLTPTHPLEPGPRRDKWESAKPITLGDNVWLGGGVVVCPGVSIGDDAVIGAGSVVTKDIPAGVLAVGNPAQVIKRLAE